MPQLRKVTPTRLRKLRTTALWLGFRLYLKNQGDLFPQRVIPTALLVARSENAWNHTRFHCVMLD